MKILLVKPTSHTDGITPPLGLGYLATALRVAHDVMIVDGPLIHLNAPKLERILNEYKPDMVGFNLISLDLYLTATYLRLIRETLPEAVTVVGGPHPSGEPEDTFYNYIPDLDYAFVGEGEKGLPMLADLLDSGRPSAKDLKTVPGLVYRDGVEFVKNPPYIEQDMDSLGFPAWDLMNPRSYPPAPHAGFARLFPVANMSATRGCPFDCEFCAARNIQGRKIRRRSIAHLMEEISLLVNRYGVKELHVVDDNFTFGRDYILEFCEQLSRRFPHLAWTCANGVRLDTLDPELLSIMKKSGCYTLAVGIESASQNVLDRARKKQTVELVRERVRMIHNSGIEVVGFFVLGFPGETIEEMESTINLSVELPLTRSQYMLFHPMPGTDIYRRIARDHPERLRAVYSSFEKLAYIEKGMSESTLKWMHKKAFLRFYLRPRQLYKLVSAVRNPMHAYYISKRIIRWMVLT